MNKETFIIQLKTGDEIKIMEGSVPWARKDIIENLKTKIPPKSYDDLFQTWQAASFLGLNEFADICSEKMDELLESEK